MCRVNGMPCMDLNDFSAKCERNGSSTRMVACGGLVRFKVLSNASQVIVVDMMVIDLRFDILTIAHITKLS